MSATNETSRATWTRCFLWLSVTTWAIALGAKIFDLIVLAAAWGANVPASLDLYPYGQRWPVDPGNFFQPLSALLLIMTLGALISGWKTQPNYRFWLWMPMIAFVLIWIATPTLFWPIIIKLYRVAHGKTVIGAPDLAVLIDRWFFYDWVRIAVIAAGFLSAVKAISLPYSPRVSRTR